MYVFMHARMLVTPSISNTFSIQRTSDRVFRQPQQRLQLAHRHPYCSQPHRTLCKSMQLRLSRQQKSCKITNQRGPLAVIDGVITPLIGVNKPSYLFIRSFIRVVTHTKSKLEHFCVENERNRMKPRT